MNELTTEIIATLVQKQDLDEFFRHHLEIAINQLLQTELAAFLGYERYSYAGINTGNNRNGSYERSFDTKYGQLNLTISRDRNASLKITPCLVGTVIAWKRRLFSCCIPR